MIELDDVAVYLGLDVGKGEHHATALTPAGKKLFDKPLPNRACQLECVSLGTVLPSSGPGGGHRR